MPQYGGGPSCGKCGKSVYFNEERTALGRKFHVNCLKCTDCNKVLDSGNCADHDGDLFCNPCHRRLYGPTGYGFAAGASGLAVADGTTREVTHNPTNSNNSAIASKFGGGARCGKCDRTVYHAEQVECLGKKFHKMCLKCMSCSKILETSTVREHEGNIYCGPCYGRDYGAHGYGFAAGAGGLSMDGAKGTKEPGTAGNSSAIAYMAPFNENKSSNAAPSKFGGAEKCNRCNNSVYHAERITGAGKVYHKQCYKCKDCNMSLDSNKLAEHDGDIFCKGCYGKAHGPKGYGYGQGAGALTLTE